jgi:NAD(P)-dependent dehydrogenase (short-subunit alcohol dehydrogenase family)
MVAGCGKRQPLVHALKREYTEPHHFSVVDVASDNQVRVWARELLTRFGPPSLLINNAAISLEPQKLWEVSDYSLAKILDVNIKGVVNTIRYFVPAMIAKRRGVLVNVTSGWGRTTDPGVAPYCATKFAVEGLTQALAQELPDGLAAVAYNPGIINTDMLKICFGEEAARYPNADAWARKAAPFLLNLGPRDNGKSVTSPK